MRGHHTDFETRPLVGDIDVALERLFRQALFEIKGHHPAADHCLAGVQLKFCHSSTLLTVIIFRRPLRDILSQRAGLFFCETVISASRHICNIKICTILQEETEIGRKRILGKLLLATQHKGLIDAGKADKVIQRVF